jgi:hypothetical protein
MRSTWTWNWHLNWEKVLVDELVGFKEPRPTRSKLAGPRQAGRQAMQQWLIKLYPIPFVKVEV